MARMQYRPQAQSRGFRTQQLSTAGIARMREESNRIIQGMERRRRAEKAQRDEHLQAMRENAAYTEQITKENNAIQLQNLKNKSQQEIANIQGAQKQAQIDNKAANDIMNSLVDFSQTIAQTAAKRTQQMIKDQNAEGAAVPLKAIDAEAVEQRLDAMALQAKGSIKLNSDIVENAVVSNEDPLETRKALLGNPGYQGIKGRTVDNRVAYKVFTSLLTSRMQDTEKVYTAANGQTYTGIEARGDQYLMDDLRYKTKVDTFKVVGGSDPLHYADAAEKMDAFGESQVNSARAEEFRRTDEALERTLVDIESAQTTEGYTLGFDGRKKAFGNAAAHDAMQAHYANPDIPVEVLDAVDINGNGKSYGETWPNRKAAGLKKRQAAYVKQVNADEALKKAQNTEWENTNIENIQQGYADDPEQMAVWMRQRYHAMGLTMSPHIMGIERAAIKKKKDILENLVEEKTKFGTLDLPFVNSIEDGTLQKQALASYEQQELAKYGEEALGIKKQLGALAKKRTGFDPSAEGNSPTTFLLTTAMTKRYVDNVKKLKDPLTAWEVTQKEIENERTDPTAVFYEDPKGGLNNKPFFPNIETSPRERVEMNNYIDKELLIRGRALVEKPFALANQNEMDAAYTSSLSGVVQYPAGIIRFAESTGTKLSEAFNAHRMANNAATGANKPLLTPSPVIDTIDNAPPWMRPLLLSDTPSQVRRAGAMLTGQPLPMRTTVGWRKLSNVIRFGEGTRDPKGYYRQFTGTEFTDTSKHPRQLRSGGGYTSDAAGAYQFLSSTWDGVKNALGLTDFSPESQEKGGRFLTQRRGVNPDQVFKTKEEFKEAMDKLAPEWASLPYSGISPSGHGRGSSYYGQGGKKLDELWEIYQGS